MSSNGLRVGVAACVCEHCAVDLDLAAVLSDSKSGKQDVAYLEAEVCRDPSLIMGFVRRNGLRALVIAMCSDDAHVKSLLSVARSSGINSLAMEHVPLKELYGGMKNKAADVAKLVLLVNVSKVRNAHLVDRTVEKTPLDDKAWISRREFLLHLTSAPTKSSEIPVMDDTACSRYVKTCRNCIDACQFNAIVHDGQRIRINRDLCVECGACAAACPVGALQNPVLSDAQLVAVVQELLRNGSRLEKRAILGTCDQGLHMIFESGKFSNPGFIPLRVPCLAALSWTHLTVLLASRVSLVGLCVNSVCDRVKALTYTEAAFRLANDLVQSLGISDARLELLRQVPSEDLERRLTATYERTPYFKDTEALYGENRRELLLSALRTLASRSENVSENTVYGDASQFFDITINGRTCTLCSACEYACPEDAIELEKDMDVSSLVFITSKCVGCYACQYACPESALTVQRTISPKKVAEEARVIKMTDDLVKCRWCGRGFASRKMLERIFRAMQVQGVESAPSWMLLCNECKGPGGLKNMVWRAG